MKGRSKHINKTLTGTDHSVVRPEGGREAGEAEGVKGVEGDGGRRGLGGGHTGGGETKRPHALETE